MQVFTWQLSFELISLLYINVQVQQKDKVLSILIFFYILLLV